jgi:Cu(I)/Ag(I) efflux system membrane fusion protein
MAAELDRKPAANPPPDTHFHEGEEAPPPGVRTMAMVRWLLLAAMALAALFSVYTVASPLFGGPPEATKTAGRRYICAMHPQIVSDRPGECPICHMDLVLAPEAAPAASAAAPPPASAPLSASAPPSSSASAPSSVSATATAKPAGHVHAGGAAPADAGSPAVSGGYTCPMHPDVHTDAPGRCPYCGMDLVPVSPPKSDSAPSDTAPITLALDRVQAVGVRTALVERLSSAGGLRLTAAVEVPEQGRAEVHVRAAGYVEAIHVKDLGVKVRAGQPLVSVYSPEVFQAQQELLAMGTWSTPGLPPPPTAAAHKKLELLGVGKETIDRIVAGGQAVRALGVSSPITGYVTKKDVVLGSYAMPDKVLFEVADLGRVYLIASAYPHQLAVVRVGDEATFTTPSLPGHVFTTKVDLVYPQMDLSTRTARVRFRVDNAELNLRPGQFGVVEIAGRRADALTIPMDAVIDTGRSLYVFIAGEGGRFEARHVELGEQIDSRFVVRAGLREGERVVSGATFLIDAESRLQASLVQTSGSAAPAGAPTGCDADFDRQKYPDKWQACRQCEVVHSGMGAMVDDCKKAIAKPWR